jgi:hypothetical protein
VKPRSVDQLRRYFAMVRAAFTHWPEMSEVQFSSEDECRKFLQMSAGWRDVGARIPLVGVNPEHARLLVAAAIKGAGAFARPVVHKGELIVWIPLSISFNSMGPQEFGQLSDAVAVVIKDMTGLDADTLLKESERAA